MFKTKSRSGKPITLLNPAEKGEKYANELRMGVKVTNDGVIKTKDGCPIPLTEEDKRFRNGYLNARKDNVNAWKSKEAKKAAKKAERERKKAARANNK